ncbi:MAG: biopolymer transporter ExbD [Verrucomicrobia bacterium]|nr:biopolymer transporter ExbD [Verrucomicrobiota bacterium]
MITRPLDLQSKLRHGPRNFDLLFLVNGGLLVMFFMLFDSKFVLAPGLGVDFRLPVMPGAMANAMATSSTISVKNSGQIFADGLLTMDQLREWLKAEARKTKQPSLLVRMSAGVPVAVQNEIVSAAREAGFGANIVLAAEEPAADGTKGR